MTNDADRANELLQKWWEKGGAMQSVLPRLVIPDAANRARTGLSAHHVHFVAMNIRRSGFSREHDVPVVVRESTSSETGRDSLDKWERLRARVKEFPRVKLDKSRPFFTSLGNGHFFQALNCHAERVECMFDKTMYGSQDQDPVLSEVLTSGVGAIVLRGDMPLDERLELSELLNSVFNENLGFVRGPGGIVSIGPVKRSQDKFLALSKTMDAFELSELVEIEMKIAAKRKNDTRSKM